MKQFITPLFGLTLLAAPAFAEDSAFITFALKNAHDRGFVGCDAAIKDAFGLAGGDDMRVVTNRFDELNDSLRMTAAYGREGDSVLVEADFRKSGGRCYASISSLLTANKSCTAYLAEMSAFKYESEAPGHIWAKNAGGVNMILRPLGANCIAVFQRSSKF